MAFAATRFEYRWRWGIHCAVYVLGFSAPWNYAAKVDGTRHLWEWMALRMGGTAAAFNGLLIAATVCACAGAALRTWGTAYLSAGVVLSPEMHDQGVIAEGPFRYMRNPLYVGTFLFTLALALLMPPSGALFAVVAIGLMQVRLIFAEEPFLLAKLGPAYAAYCARVPRVLPSGRKPAHGGETAMNGAPGIVPLWGQAVVGESLMIGVAVVFVALGWRYDAWLLTKGVVVALGVSIVLRALFVKRS